MQASPRKNMILSQVFTNEVTDRRILQAMNDVPREPFLPEHLRGAAYIDEDLDIGNGRALMAPLTFAQLLDLAEITPSCRVLNIGCMTGYTAAVIAKLAGHVVAIDIDAAAIEQARVHVKRLALRDIDLEPVRSLVDGYALSAPYDVIVISGAVGFIPEKLSSQLGAGGRLVTVLNRATRPDSRGGLGKGLLVKRVNHTLQHREHFDASAVILPGFEQETSFRF